MYFGWRVNLNCNVIIVVLESVVGEGLQQHIRESSLPKSKP